MRNRLIPRSEWPDFFAGFSRRHTGQGVKVLVFDPRLGAQVEARDLPFGGVVAPATAGGPISIHVGSARGANIEHEIRDPRQVWVETDDAGREEVLEVESDDGTKTILQFRPGGPAAGEGERP